MRLESTDIVVWLRKRCRSFARACGLSDRADRKFPGTRYEHAYRKLQAACACEHPACECFVGFTCVYGPGTLNPALGAKWFLMGAHRGDRACQWFLGELYANGEGVPRDPVLAYFWTARAAGNGLMPAVADAVALKRNLTTEQLRVADVLPGGSYPHPAGSEPCLRVIECRPTIRSRASAA